MKEMMEKKVVILIQFDKDGNYEVFNWVAKSKREARQIVETTIKEIREVWKDRLDEHNKVYVDEEPIIGPIKLTKEWVSADNCHLYFGNGKPSMDDWFDSRIQFNFFIKDSEN